MAEVLASSDRDDKKKKRFATLNGSNFKNNFCTKKMPKILKGPPCQL
jgi:hypothetical protein